MKKRITLEHDCLDCKKFLSCSDTNKAVNYVCSKFKLRKSASLEDIFSNALTFESDEIDMSDIEGESTKKTSQLALDLDKKVNVSKMIESILETDLLTPVDTKVDDSSIPLAKNFFEFTTGQKFLAVKPYLFQMLYITQLFAEYCPRCSDVNWMRNGAKVDDSLAYFQTKVVCLHNGVCPVCGAHRSELVRNGELNFYQELAGLAGQRCLVGDTLVPTETGYEKISNLCLNDTEGFCDANINLFSPDYKPAKATKTFKSSPAKTKKLILENGMEICGTYEHPIKTVNGYMPIAAIPNGTKIPIKFGHKCFGNVPVDKDIAQFYGLYFAQGNRTINNTKQNLKVVLRSEVEYIMNDDKILLMLETKPQIEDVYAFDQTAALFFLRSYLPNQDNCDSKSQQIAMLWLQAFGLPFYQEDGKIFVDGDSEIAAKTLLGTLPLIGKKLYKSYEYYKDSFTFNIPVRSVIEQGFEETFDFVVDGYESFSANGFDNHNSGKSAIVAMCCAYLLHKQLKLQKPNEIYGLLPANVLHGTFVALTYKQAAETLWEPFLAYITDSPWFCVAEDSKISMADGTTKFIKDCKVGEKVSTFEGQSTIKKVFDNGAQECFKVELEDGKFVEATDSHKFAVDCEGKLQWKKVKELRIGDSLILN